MAGIGWGGSFESLECLVMTPIHTIRVPPPNLIRLKDIER